MSDEQKRITRNFCIDHETHEWLKRKAAAQKRPVIKQVEVLLEQARMMDIARVEKARLEEKING